MFTRKYLNENRSALNEQDASMIENLRLNNLCMHRRIDGEGYVFCGNPGTRFAARGRIVFCKAHRKQ
jgi:hypothetical protein